MNPNIPSIEQLKELGLPAPISYAPQTWGWWVLLAVLLLTALAIGARRYRQWRRDRYRREALVRLALLRDRSDDLNALRELPELLKRVAISMPQSQSVAAAEQEDWQHFLQQHSKKTLPADFSQQLARLAYAPDDVLRDLPAPQRQALFDTCQHWVEHHHVAA
ncbi:hypothetical protein CP336_12825 [Pseudomonas fluorescens]|nr:hypothetical protein CP336_12825 [Pseudomonas fluorescens]